MKEYNSEEICIVIMWRNRGVYLTPYHVDILDYRHGFHGSNVDNLIMLVVGLSAEDQQRRKETFKQDLQRAQEEDGQSWSV